MYYTSILEVKALLNDKQDPMSNKMYILFRSLTPARCVNAGKDFNGSKCSNKMHTNFIYR